MKTVIVSGPFDDLRAGQVRFLEEAAKIGPIRVLLWPDETVQTLTGCPPKFPVLERLYVLRAIRYVAEAEIGPEMKSAHVLCDVGDPRFLVWAITAKDDHSEKRTFAGHLGIELRAIPDAGPACCPVPPVDLSSPSSRRKVIVTGCYDWFHSGHVRFFEEAASCGELTVSVGSDANVRLLKGENHPKFPQDVRRYMVAAVRHVARAVIGSGEGWMDAAPEIEALKPDLYIVNEDGDRPEKRAFCEARGISYLVLKRVPAAGLARRDSTTLRGY